MDTLATNAATAWAQAHAARFMDPVEFGSKVALVCLACQDTRHFVGNSNVADAVNAAYAAMQSATVVSKAPSVSEQILRSAGYGPDSIPPEPEPQDFSPKKPKPPSPSEAQRTPSAVPSFHGIAKGKAEWFEVSAVQEGDSASPIKPSEATPPASAQSLRTTASPAVAPSAPGDSPSDAVDPETSEEKPLC